MLTGENLGDAGMGGRNRGSERGRAGGREGGRREGGRVNKV